MKLIRVFLLTVFVALTFHIQTNIVRAEVWDEDDPRPEQPTCIRLNEDATRAVNGSCQGYVIDGKPFEAQPGKCYLISTVTSGSENWEIHEINCADADSVRTSVNNGDGVPQEYSQLFSSLPGAEDCSGVIIGFKVGCDPKTADENPIWTYLRAILKFLSAGVGLVIVLMIVISGIQYITSSGNPQAIQSAKGKFINAIIALLLFIFMAAILNYLVPGGLL